MALPMFSAFSVLHLAPAVPMMFSSESKEVASSVDAKLQETKAMISTMAQKVKASPKRMKCGSVLTHLSEWMSKASSMEGVNYEWQAQKQVSSYVCRFNKCISQADSNKKRDSSKTSAMFNKHPQMYGNLGSENKYSSWSYMQKLPAL